MMMMPIYCVNHLCYNRVPYWGAKDYDSNLIEYKRINMKLSVILPCYREAANLPAMLSVLTETLSTIDFDIEIVAIDDGSPDNTYQVLVGLQQQYPQLHIVRFARNFGKEAALTCGLQKATGDVVVMMDSDLQHPPEVIISMLEKWQSGVEMVYALRRGRDGDGIIRQMLTKSFYWIFRNITELNLPRGAGDFRLMDRKVVDAINQLPERNRFMKGLMTWVGFDTDVIYFDAPARKEGQSGWPLTKLFHLAFDGITSFSIIPLRIWSLFGALISLGALLYIVCMVVRVWIWGVELPGYASLICSILLIGGIQLLSLGIIGEYIGRIYNEVKGRPIYLIGKEIPAQTNKNAEVNRPPSFKKII